MQGELPCQAAAINAEVSNALLITGMWGANVGAVFFADLTAAGAATAAVATSARSPWPCSWERATEKNKNI